jgi:hypothetical protein
MMEEGWRIKNSLTFAEGSQILKFPKRTRGACIGALPYPTRKNDLCGADIASEDKYTPGREVRIPRRGAIGYRLGQKDRV